MRPMKEKVATGKSTKRFRKLLQVFEPRRPRRGSIVEGEVLWIDEDAILMDIEAHQDALVPRKELAKLSGRDLERIQVGDRMPVYVTRTARWGGDLVVSIHRGLAQHDWDRAQQYLEDGENIELEVVGENRGGALVQFGRLRGFVPNSHIPGLRGRSRAQKREHKQELIGSTLTLRVIEVNPKRRRLVLSAREARRRLRRQRLEELQVGQVIEGRVVNLVDFGAFIDLGGVHGLLHISELSHRTDIEHPQDELERDQQLEVMIKDIDVERERVKLSRKALLPSPWQQVAARYAAGELVEGVVTNVVDFGAFVRLPDGIEGMIHKSELGITSIEGPSAVVEQGERVLARILEIDPEAERMRLSLREVTYQDQEDWSQAGDDQPAKGNGQQPASDGGQPAHSEDSQLPTSEDGQTSQPNHHQQLQLDAEPLQ